MFRIALAIGFIFATGCAHLKQSEQGQYPTYSDAVKELNLDSSFAFRSNGHDYYFVMAQTKGFIDECSRFDGYKDNRLWYSFPMKVFKDLQAIYSLGVSIEQKIQRVIHRIESNSPRMYQCIKSPEEPKKPLMKNLSDKLGDGMTFVVYGSITVIFSPIIVPMVVAESMAEKSVEKRLQKIALGLSTDQINEIMKLEFVEEKSGPYLIHTYDVKNSSGNLWKRLVFVYNDQKLMAYVWGLRP